MGGTYYQNLSGRIMYQGGNGPQPCPCDCFEPVYWNVEIVAFAALECLSPGSLPGSQPGILRYGFGGCVEQIVANSVLVMDFDPSTCDITLTAYTPPITTVGVGSNGVDLSSAPGAIYVLSTAGFPSSGTLTVITDAGPQSVAYTGTAGGDEFTGVTGGAGVMSTGNSVNGTGTIPPSAMQWPFVQSTAWQPVSVEVCYADYYGAEGDAPVWPCPISCWWFWLTATRGDVDECSRNPTTQQPIAFPNWRNSVDPGADNSYTGPFMGPGPYYETVSPYDAFPGPYYPCGLPGPYAP